MTDNVVKGEWDARTYRGVGPHAHDPDAFDVATIVASCIERARPGTDAKHVGSTAVEGLVGKGIVDLQITAEPSAVEELTDVLLSIGFSRQGGPDPWPKERPMLVGTVRHKNAKVFAVHCHVVPTDDRQVHEMIALRDLLRADPSARERYAAEKRRIVAKTTDVYAYTEAKTGFIVELLRSLGLRS
jgi:GrpB-like predicted nucleotidyltransferase (UPF0157 family)